MDSGFSFVVFLFSLFFPSLFSPFWQGMDCGERNFNKFELLTSSIHAMLNGQRNWFSGN